MMMLSLLVVSYLDFELQVLIDYPGINIPFGKYAKKHFGKRNKLCARVACTFSSQLYMCRVRPLRRLLFVLFGFAIQIAVLCHYAMCF